MRFPHFCRNVAVTVIGYDFIAHGRQRRVFTLQQLHNSVAIGHKKAR